MISTEQSRICLRVAPFSLFIFLLLGPLPLWAGLPGQDAYAKRMEAAYQDSKAQYRSATNLTQSAWVFARACYDLADLATNDSRRATLAKEGIAACHKLIAAQPNSGPGHYYLGMNEGELARTEMVGALFLVGDMEKEFKLAWGLDKSVDHGGPARSLGLLYRDAPDWPASIGSRSKSREWLLRAESYDPGFPENPMALTESFLKWGDYKDAGRYLQSLRNIWPHAQTNYTGLAWEYDWADWTNRRDAAQAQIERHLDKGKR